MSATLNGWTARTLTDKYDEAVKYRDKAKTYLDGVEEGIPGHVLRQWKEEEAEWLTKVVDIKNHKTLDNPFTAPKESGKAPVHYVDALNLKLRTALSKAATLRRIKSPEAQVAGGYALELVGAIEGMVDLERER